MISFYNKSYNVEFHCLNLHQFTLYILSCCDLDFCAIFFKYDHDRKIYEVALFINNTAVSDVSNCFFYMFEKDYLGIIYGVEVWIS